MKNGRCFWQRGKIVSGTGGINGNVFLIGRPEDYDDWRAQGNSGWGWQDIYQYFVKATEDQSSPDNPKGSLVLNHFPRMDNFHILTELMTNATAEIEAPLANKSPGYMPNILATVERGKRMSTGKTYLGKVAKYRRNLHVLKNAEVRKIIFNRHKKAVGLEVMLNNTKALNIRGRKEIILSAGTFNSLRELNITCFKDLAVGENLQDHGMMSLTLKFTKNIPVMPESDTLTNTFEYLAFQKGPLASHKNLVGFINSRAAENINRTDLMLVSGINRPARGSNMFEFLQFREDFVEKFLEIAENLTILEIQGLLIKPKSRGYIKLRSAELGSGPIIYNNYATAEEDRQTLLRMVRYIQKLQKSEIFRHYGLKFIRLPLEDCDLLPFESDEYWLCYVKYFYISSWHGVGTCRMGPQSDALAVVDSQLRVHGVNGLRVIDASIMPNITSANTNGPTIMIGEKGAHMIMEELANAIGDA